MESVIPAINRAICWACAVLVVTFFISCNRLLVTFDRQAPHDGLNGLGAVALGFSFALLLAALAFITYLLFAVARWYVRKVDSIE